VDDAASARPGMVEVLLVGVDSVESTTNVTLVRYEQLRQPAALVAVSH